MGQKISKNHALWVDVYMPQYHSAGSTTQQGVGQGLHAQHHFVLLFYRYCLYFLPVVTLTMFH